MQLRKWSAGIEMIEARSLTKYYGPHPAAVDLSFEAHRGEVVGLLGPNGAGKTTTIRMLTGFMPPTSGTALVAGCDIVADSLAARQRVGYLPERVPVYPDMTVRGYITFWAELRGVRRPRAQVDATLERVQLAERSRSLIRHLSKGMRQRLGLAQALVHNPEVLILDEPTIGIDPQQVIEVRQLVRQLGGDRTVLFSTHILSEAEQICDRVLIIHQGHIVAQGAPASLREQLQPGAHIYVALDCGANRSAYDILAGLPGIESIQQQSEGYTLRFQPGVDARADIAEAVLRAGCRLLEMRPVAMTLEDIFLDVIGKVHQD